MICNETDGSGPHDDVWTRRISGMRIYSEERMESDLREAGFRSVNVYRKDGRRWICVRETLNKALAHNMYKNIRVGMKEV